MKRVFLASTVLALLACAGVKPTEGVYDVEVTDFESTASCTMEWGLDLGAYTDRETLLVDVSDVTGDVTFEGGLECEMGGAAFECADESDTYLGDGFDDARQLTTLTAEGEFTTSTHFLGEWDLTLRCDGRDCSELGYDPCDITFTLEGTLD